MEYYLGINSQHSMDKESGSNIENPRKLLYMNWGWNENNGWFSNEKLLNSEGRFYIEEIVANIYPEELIK